jgi:hypothetical protein
MKFCELPIVGYQRAETSDVIAFADIVNVCVLETLNILRRNVVSSEVRRA